MLRIIFALSFLFSINCFAKNEKNLKPIVERGPATQGEFSFCNGVSGPNNLEVTIFTQGQSFAEIKPGGQIQLAGSIASGTFVSGEASLEVSKIFTMTQTKVNPKKGSGWNDILLSISTLTGSLVFDKKEPQEVLLHCENRDRSRY